MTETLTSETLTSETVEATSPAFEALLAESQRTGLPLSYQNDLLVHDRARLTRANAPQKFVWQLRETGTNLYADKPEFFECSCGRSSDLLYLYDGSNLRKATYDECRDFLIENERIPNEPEAVTVTLAIPDFEDLIHSLPYKVRHRKNTDTDYVFEAKIEKLPYSAREALYVAKHKEGTWDYPKISLREALRASYDLEVDSLLHYASRAKSGFASMTLFSLQGSQYICNFSVQDRNKPNHPDETNWHGQNTSQWVYGGAIVIDVETGSVSTHH